MATFNVDVVAARGAVWSGAATAVYARSVAGEIGILHGHQPVLLVLVPSAVRIVAEDGHEERFEVDGGVLYYRQDAHDHLVVLAENVSGRGAPVTAEDE